MPFSVLRPSFRRRIKLIIGELFLGPIYIRAIFAFLVSVILGAVSYIRNPPERQDEIFDLGVYSLIYGAWIIFCAPMLLATINVRLVLQTVHIVARVSTRSVPSVNPFFNVRLVFQWSVPSVNPFFNVRLVFQWSVPSVNPFFNVRLVIQWSVPSVNPFFNARLVFQTVHIVARVSSPLTEGKDPFFNVRLVFQTVHIVVRESSMFPRLTLSLTSGWCFRPCTSVNSFFNVRLVFQTVHIG